ncbi:hypothetical protein FF80_02258 [Devosia sp. LC5]|uniref:DUF2798 domain-containing protein n=1 Tax=Devosia sp. LC5 TaxID=1502724 RepID=UPI0004E41B88|nr:DUF2798 domain-containing protein [Devosia sp. LC5]KFC67337.1 hypothetical protein FF80_02258 [Devosia sp. LC5]
MTNKKTLILAQALISLMMAFCMTGIFTFLPFGATTEWLAAWSKGFIMAWPIAFCLSMPVGKIAFGIAGRLMARAAA